MKKITDILAACEDVQQALAQLREQQAYLTFTGCPQGWYCPETREHFCSDALHLLDCHRYYLNKRVRQVTLLYLVITPNGTLGVILDNCGTYCDPQMAQNLLTLKLRQLPPYTHKVAENITAMVPEAQEIFPA